MTKFKPLLDAPEFEVCEPYRAKVKEIFRIAAETESLPAETRLQYAENAGMKPDLESGKLTVKNTYNSYNAVPALAKALFVGFPDAFDEDKLNEGEVNRAFIHFNKRRNGI